MSVLKTPPALERYLEVKKEHPNHVLFYRMGDFYEMFFEDAKVVAPVLGLCLTKRGKCNDVDVPMCGVPAGSFDVYVSKLVKNGFKVAICEQLETAEEAKKRGSASIIKRKVVRVITPGTLTEDGLLSEASSNYLMSASFSGENLALAWADISTGRFFFRNKNQIS